MQPRPGLEGLMTPAEAKNTECVSTSQVAPQPETGTVCEASSGLPAAASLKPCLHGPLGQEETARSAAQDTADDIRRKCRQLHALGRRRKHVLLSRSREGMLTGACGAAFRFWEPGWIFGPENCKDASDARTGSPEKTESE